MEIVYEELYRLKVFNTGEYVSNICRWPYRIGYLTTSESFNPNALIRFRKPVEDDATSSVGAGAPVVIIDHYMTSGGYWSQHGSVNTVKGSGAGSDTFLFIEPDVGMYAKPAVFSFEPVNTI